MQARNEDKAEESNSSSSVNTSLVHQQQSGDIEGTTANNKNAFQ
jgi:hypothetical protein